jgi:hypothetical protein
MKELINKLTAVGIPVQSRGKLLISEFGGRIIGLFPDKETNLLWVNPDAMKQEIVNAWRTGKDWSNIGGNRVWLSPEIDTNVRDPMRMMETYSVPPEVDPGSYRLTVEDDEVYLSQDVTIEWIRLAKQIQLEVERRIIRMDHPNVAISGDTSFAGYQSVSMLRASGSYGTARPGLWDIVQVPRGGRITCLVPPGTHPTPAIGYPEWEEKNGLLQTGTLSQHSFKWSLRASQSQGRLVYLHRIYPHRSTLLVRNFQVGNDEDYADCPCSDPLDTGHMCQVYVDNGDLGDFAELEFHTPFLSPGIRDEIVSKSTLMGFVGPTDEIVELYRMFTK